MAEPTRQPLGGTVMLRGGSVHSPVDPFATAVLLQYGVVRWVGQEAGADSLVDDSVRVVELDGLLVAPGFAVGLPEGPRTIAPAELLSAGYCLAVDLSGDAPKVLPLDGPSTGRVRSVENPGTEPAETAPAPEAGALRVVRGAATESLDRSEAPVLLAVDPFGDDEWVDEVHTLLRAGTPTGLLPLAVRDSLPSPWALARTGLRAGEDPEEAPGLSVRGTFNLQTRGVRRVLDEGSPFHGQIVPDARASFTVWRAEALMVQTADSRIAAWSTDPRARTPLLPALESDERFPEAVLTVIGTTAFATAGLRL